MNREIPKWLKTIALVIVVIAIVISIWFAWYLHAKEILADDPALAGQMGDMFGGITALFSGLAFAGFILTLILQQKELSLTREVLIDQREELKLTREVMILQKSELAEQRKNQSKMIEMDRQKSLPVFHVDLDSEWLKERLKSLPTDCIIYHDTSIAELGLSTFDNADKSWLPFGFRLQIHNDSFAIRDLRFSLNRSTVENVIILEGNPSSHWLGAGDWVNFTLWVKKPSDSEIMEQYKDYTELPDDERSLMRNRFIEITYFIATGEEVRETLKFFATVTKDGEESHMICNTHCSPQEQFDVLSQSYSNRKKSNPRS